MYDADSMVWIEKKGDLNPSLDSVATMVNQSASYAIGVEIAASFDQSAPEIQDYYPKEADTVAPKAKYWAKLNEPPTDVGIDLSRTMIKIDTTIVDAFWNPAERIISYEPPVPLSPGNHTFEVIAVDNNGNLASKTSGYYSEFLPYGPINKNLSAGWTWFSINVEDADMSIPTVLGSLNPQEGDYIKNQTVSATYYTNAGWFGDLTEIDPKEMYKIKLSQADSLRFSGFVVDPAYDSIKIRIGWNWIGYLPQTGDSVSSALSSISVSANDYIKNQTKSSTFYDGFGWFGELVNLEPLDGYMLKTSLTDTLTFPGSSSGSFMDSRDSTTYKWIKIGTQTWMAENLAYLPEVSPSGTGSETGELCYVYDYEGTLVNEAKTTDNFSTYGVLYNWRAAMTSDASSALVPSGVQGVCPAGWHLPSDAEWTILSDYLTDYGYGDGGSGNDIANSMWSSSTRLLSTNSSGFTAVPGGSRYCEGNRFDGLTRYAAFWSSTEGSSSSAWLRGLIFDNSLLYRNHDVICEGFSIRCLKD
jgi:uncharacterized protein (TIGR02145 family)